MSNQNDSRSQHHGETPSTEDRGLQPAKNPPQMPQVKPTKSESSTKKQP